MFYMTALFCLLIVVTVCMFLDISCGLEFYIFKMFGDVIALMCAALNPFFLSFCI